MFLDPNLLTFEDRRFLNVRPWKTLQVGDLDIYLSPKCATNTLRYIAYLHAGGKEEVSDIRDSTYDVLKLTSSSILTYASERKNAKKLCVKRDPVERVLSALVWYNWKYNQKETIDTILEMIPDDIHFWPQTCFYGDPQKYDYIVNLNEIISTINNHLNTSYSLDIHKGQTELIKPTLDDDQRTKLKHLYKVDYENGYC